MNMLAAVLAVLAGAYIVLVLIAGLSGYWGLFHQRVKPSGEALSAALQRGFFDASFLELPWEEFSVPSPRGFEIAGGLLASGKADAPTILLIHGITWNRYFALKFGHAFAREGWNIAAVDLAGHGASAAPPLAFPSYGVGDKLDLAAVLAFLGGRFPKSSGFGLAGESLGAATALQCNALVPAAGLPQLSFVVADCSFSNMDEETVFQFEKRGLPACVAVPATALSSLLTRLRRGFFLREASPAAAVLEARSPVLFIHGAEDRFVPASMSIAMYDSMILAGKQAKLLIMPGAGHGKSWKTSPAVWERVALDFARRALSGQPIGLEGFPTPVFPLDKTK
jgi:pimeloyl-ACP methyl ester carboxylesterase